MSPEARRTRHNPRIALAGPPRAARLAEGILQDSLERHVAALEREARLAGVNEGRAGALAGAAGALSLAAERLDAAREAAQETLSRTAVQLAVEIARALLRVEVRRGDYDLEGMVRETLSLSGAGRGRCVVHAHPEDAALLSSVSFRAGTVVEPDESLSRGSVRVATPHGLLVRDLDEALRSIGERLLGDLS